MVCKIAVAADLVRGAAGCAGPLGLWTATTHRFDCADPAELLSRLASHTNEGACFGRDMPATAILVG